MIPAMKTQKVLFVAGVLLSVLCGVAMASTAQVVDLGARYHTKHSEFVSLPYADGDLTYTVGYEIHEENSMLQFACALQFDSLLAPSHIFTFQ